MLSNEVSFSTTSLLSVFFFFVLLFFKTSYNTHKSFPVAKNVVLLISFFPVLFICLFVLSLAFELTCTWHVNIALKWICPRRAFANHHLHQDWCHVSGQAHSFCVWLRGNGRKRTFFHKPQNGMNISECVPFPVCGWSTNRTARLGKTIYMKWNTERGVQSKLFPFSKSGKKKKNWIWDFRKRERMSFFLSFKWSGEKPWMWRVSQPETEVQSWKYTGQASGGNWHATPTHAITRSPGGAGLLGTRLQCSHVHDTSTRIGVDLRNAVTVIDLPWHHRE